MSKAPICAERFTNSLTAELILDSWVLEGGLDLNTSKKEESLSLELKNLSYAFLTDEGFSIEARLYWVIEDDKPRQYLWMECCIGRLTCNSELAMRHLLETSRELPAPFKFGLSDEYVVFCLRGPSDGFNIDFLQDLIDGIIPCASKLYEDLKTKFLIPSWKESLQKRAIAH